MVNKMDLSKLLYKDARIFKLDFWILAILTNDLDEKFETYRIFSFPLTTG